uniref:Variant surface glycoprotein 1125.2116 n=1 Tax=Trypanosoma brucei TaxID=5691 RepID=A0A1J0R893_9TRYP|nr:variant surface glycoprotein 1125.2116 [Trypanosoma brucei]
MAAQAGRLSKAKDSTTNNGGGNKATGGNAATCVAYANAKLATQDLCPQDSRTDAKIKEAARKTAQLTKLPLTPDDAFTFTNYKITIAWHGTAASIKHALTGNDVGCGSVTGGGSATASLSGTGTHYVGITGISREETATKPTEQTIATQALPRSHGGTSSDMPSSDRLVTAAATVDAIRQIKALKFPTTAPLQDDTIAELSNDADSQKAAWLVTAGKATTTQTPEALKKEVENLLGHKTKTVKELFLNTLSNTKLPNAPNDDTLKQALPAIAAGDDYATALAFCHGMNAKQVQIKTVTTTDSQVSECKGTKEDDCDKEKCEFKEGKCQAKVITPTGTDAKNTNTTGSNSFVINKAPLLLAVLLF